MAIFFSDIDSTLIYSKRWDIGTDKVNVEILRGCEHSFMNKTTFDYLKKAEWLKLVPVTARSKSQLSRIYTLGKSVPCEKALIYYGGDLLINGNPDGEWFAETRRMVMNQAPAILEAHRIMTYFADPMCIYMPASYLCYAAGEKLEKLEECLRHYDHITSRVDIVNDGRKLYCLARAVNKGVAIERYFRRFGYEKCVAAGDSYFDIPMLEKADVALASDKIADKISGKRVYNLGSGDISTKICDVLESLKSEGFFDNE